MESLAALLTAGDLLDARGQPHLHELLQRSAAGRRRREAPASGCDEPELLAAATAQARAHAQLEGRLHEPTLGAGAGALDTLVRGLGPRLHGVSQLCASAAGAGGFLHLLVPAPRLPGGLAPPAARRLPWLHVPPQAWAQAGARLAGVPTKTAVFEALAAAGERLVAVALQAGLAPATVEQVVREWRVFATTAAWAAHVLEPAAASLLGGSRAAPKPAVGAVAESGVAEGEEAAQEATTGGSGGGGDDGSRLGSSAGVPDHRPPPPLVVVAGSRESAAAADAAAAAGGGGEVPVDGDVKPSAGAGAAATTVGSLKTSLFQRAMRNVSKTAAAAVARTVNAAAAAAVVASESGLSVSATVKAAFSTQDHEGSAAARAAADAAAAAGAPAGWADAPSVVPLSLTLPVPVGAAELQRYAAALGRLHVVVEGVLQWLGDLARGDALLARLARAAACAPPAAYVDLRGVAQVPPGELQRLLGDPVDPAVLDEAAWLLHCARLWRQACASLLPLVAASCDTALACAAAPVLLGDVRTLTERYVHKQCDALRRVEGLD